jgi:metal-responsive CopG/Arc/MetJ family transcriptional regulator
MKEKGRVRTVVMPDDLWEKLRVASIHEKRSASEIIRQLVHEYLEKGGKRR